MRTIDRDSLPHLVNCFHRLIDQRWSTFRSRIAASWWGVSLGAECTFRGLCHFSRHPRSRIIIGGGCEFLSSPTANLIGINHPCMISTLAEDAIIEIGSKSGFSGTVIGCATRITIGEDVRCGANTLITDTDWHVDDSRASADMPVIIEDGVWLGVNVTVLKGVRIGKNTLVGAGSVVTKSLPPGVVAAGIPAKPLRDL